jgi:protein pelota
VEEVKKGGGEVLIFSSIHESGKQLDQLTGVAAILSFPLPDIESDDEEDPAGAETA